MELDDLNWDDVPPHVSVLAHKDGTLNFVLNLTVNVPDARWVFEGDECDVDGCVINPDEGWPQTIWRLLERPTNQVASLCPVYADPKLEQQRIVVEWLDKLAYIIQTDTTVGAELNISHLKQAVLFTDHGDVKGNQNVVEFINNRYSQLTEQANKAKREQLLKDIVSAKEAYEAKVLELELLEKGL